MPTTNPNPPAGAQKYVPGVCNIGPAERAKRRQGGIVGLIATLAVFGILLALHAPKGWRLLLILPASMAATGFLQDAMHFCAGFGMKGLYNVANSAGVTDDVTQALFRRKDRRKAQTIIVLSLVIGLIVALLSML